MAVEELIVVVKGVLITVITEEVQVLLFGCIFHCSGEFELVKVDRSVKVGFG